MEISSLAQQLSRTQLEDQSHVGEVRRAANAIANELGFSETDRGRVALVVTEGATNLLRHAGGGTLLLRAVRSAHRNGIEALFQDKGPGILDVRRALQDGHSTGGTLGAGLGAMARQADVFDLYSAAGDGTVLLAQVWEHVSGSAAAGSGGHPEAGLEFGAVCAPHPGETVSGDAWAAAQGPWGGSAIVADGLGHGVLAADASHSAVRVFANGPSREPGELLSEIHAALRPTRGATVGIARLDRERREVRFAGIGNIAAAVVTPSDSRSMVSLNGTVGHEIQRVQEFVYPWPSGAVVLMHSDGLQSRWHLGRYPGLLTHHPGVIAGVLHRDYVRGRDDVTVLAIKESR